MFDVEFIPVPERVLAEMLRLAEVRADDVVYDLGCGEGRIVIAAARECGAQAVGVDLDAALLARAQAAAIHAGVAERVRFQEEDLFTTDLRPASVLMLYLLDSLNVRLRPRILAQCRPGTRVVTYSFEMGEWAADAHTPIAANGVSLWIVPANVTGRWEATPDGGAGGVEALELEQTFQGLRGRATVGGGVWTMADARVRGTEFAGTLQAADSSETLRLTGVIEGEAIVLGGDCAGVVSRVAKTMRAISPPA